MRIPRAACINDISGFGRCSLTTAISVLSAAGVQACPIPTAILSKHTGFDKFFFHDFTHCLKPYMSDWEDIEFDGIYSGFLGSGEQIQAVEEFIKHHGNGCVVVDPVMGDSGKLYATYTKQMQKEMKRLVSLADILTPNITEICFLTDTEYCGEEIFPEQAVTLIKKLREKTSAKIVLTGISKGDKMLNMTYDSAGISISEVQRENRVFSGTGDLFASVICAFILKGRSLHRSVDIAGRFISQAIERTVSSGTPLSEGVIFEPILHKLWDM